MRGARQNSQKNRGVLWGKSGYPNLKWKEKLKYDMMKETAEKMPLSKIPTGGDYEGLMEKI